MCIFPGCRTITESRPSRANLRSHQQDLEQGTTYIPGGIKSVPSEDVTFYIPCSAWCLPCGTVLDAPVPAGRHNSCYRTIFDPLMSSNLPQLIIAAAFFLYTSFAVHSIILAASAIASLIYHSTKEQRYLYLDKAFAYTSSASTLRLMILARHNHNTIPLYVVLSVDIVVAISCYVAANANQQSANKHMYSLLHTSWHLAIAVGQAALFLFYTTSNFG